MFYRVRHNPHSRILVVITMVFSLLLAQGLRVCVHDESNAETLHASAGATHLETNFAADDDESGASSAWHASFSIALKQLKVAFELLAVVVALLILPFLVLTLRLPETPAAATLPSGIDALRPPLRAPPL